MLCCLVLCGWRETSFVTTQLEASTVSCVCRLHYTMPTFVFFCFSLRSSVVPSCLAHFPVYTRWSIHSISCKMKQVPALVPTNRLNFTLRTRRVHLSPLPAVQLSLPLSIELLKPLKVIQCSEKRNAFVFILGNLPSIDIIVTSSPSVNYTYLLTYGSWALPEKLKIVCSHSGIYQHFKEHEGSSPYSQEPSTGP
jgi:hypothetical protein